MPDQIPPQEKKIVVWVPCLKTTMEIAERDFNPAYMIKPETNKENTTKYKGILPRQQAHIS